MSTPQLPLIIPRNRVVRFLRLSGSSFCLLLRPVRRRAVCGMVALLGLWVWLNVGVALAQNILLNPSFEQYTGTQPNTAPGAGFQSGLTPTSWINGGSVYDNTVPTWIPDGTGTSSLSSTLGSQEMHQDVAAVSGSGHSITFFDTIHDLTSTIGHVTLQYLDSGGVPLGSPSIFTSVHQFFPAGTNLGGPYTLTSGPAPVGTAFVRVGIDISANGLNVQHKTDAMILTAIPLVAVGNLVFYDKNGDGDFDPGVGADVGINGVEVQLWSVGANTNAENGGGDDVRLLTGPDGDLSTTADNAAATLTGSGGCYLFKNLPPGDYYVRIPAAEFGSGKPLTSLIASTPAGANDSLDDTGDQNGSLSGTDIVSQKFTLSDNGEPTNEAGKDAVNATNVADNNNTNLTIDFGFKCLTFNEPPITLAEGVVGTPYSVTLGSTGGLAPYTYSGTPPAGLTLSPAGVISGTPTTPTATPFAVNVTDASGCPGTRLLTIRVCGVIGIGPIHAGTPVVGTPYTFTFNPSGGVLPYACAVTGTLPTGVTLGVGSCTLSGTPTAPGPYNFTVTVTDSLGCTGSRVYAAGTVCPTFSLSPGSLPTGTVGVPYSQQLSTDGGSPMISYTVTTGTLPTPMSLSTSGLLSGTPTAASITPITIMATDFYGCTSVTSYTLTIGTTPTVGLGNLVYIDRNNDGNYDPGEGIDGVRVELYRADTSFVGFIITSGGGCYLFSGLPAGSYYVKLPGSNFTGTGALAGTISRPGNAADTQTDDTTDENGIDDPNFVTGGAGIRSSVIALSDNGEPTNGAGEGGKDNASDDADDNNTDLTIDFAFRKPLSFTEWVQAHGYTGPAALPEANPDGDGYTNAQEFAFCFPPESGLNPGCPLSFQLNLDGSIDVRLLAISDAIGVTYRLDGAADLARASGAVPTAWFNVGTTITPTVVKNPNGTEVRTSHDVEIISALTTNGRGFFTVVLTIDTDGNGSQDHTTTTAVVGYLDRRINTQCETCNNPFLKCAPFSGVVTGNTATALDVSASVGTGSLGLGLFPGKSYYVEVIDGPQEGHRFTIDPATTTATSLGILSASIHSTKVLTPGLLTGAPIVVREFWQMAEQFPPSLYQRGTSQATSDYGLFYENGAWSTYYASSLSTGRWVKVGSGATSFDAKIIDPARGLYIHRQDGPAAPPLTKTERPIDIVMFGEVRENDFACPLPAGESFFSGGWPLSQSIAERRLTLADGFTGGTSQLTADRLYRWLADEQWAFPQTRENYQTFWQLNIGTGPYKYWTQAGFASLPNKNADLSFFSPGRSVFISLRNAKPNYVMPLPWRR
jgi:SdrD B-like domain/Putative Ig domain